MSADRSSIRIMQPNTYSAETRYDADAMLDAAKNGELQDVVVLGWKKDGGFFMSSNVCSRQAINWMLDVGKDSLIQGAKSK